MNYGWIVEEIRQVSNEESKIFFFIVVLQLGS